MRRFTFILVLCAILIGTFSPITASLSSKNILTFQTQHAYAIGDGDDGTANAALNSADKDKSAQDDGGDPAAPYLYNCGFTGANPIGGCMERITYFIPYQIGAYFLSKAAQFFDWTAAFTLSSGLYTATPFITEGWRVCRDFANMFFIFILLYIAVCLVLDLNVGGVNPKKTLASLVVIALVINFSFFISEVVIDTSNTLALVFYNQISVNYKDSASQAIQKDAADTYKGVQASVPQLDVNPKEISVTIAEGMKPGVLQSGNFFKALAEAAYSKGIEGGDGGKVIPAGVLISLYLMVGAMYLIAAWAFFMAAISFIGRLIGLWVLIVFAPFAFLTYLIPSARTIQGFGWSTWWNTLIKAAFGAPIFFFMLLLISRLGQTSFINTKILETQGASIVILGIVLSFAVMITLLLKATKYAKMAAGEIGEIVTKGAGIVGGIAVGAVTGGAAFALSRGLGRAGNAVQNNQKLQDTAAGIGVTGPLRGLKKFAARQTLKASKGATTGSFDIRQTNFGNLVSKKTGMNFQSVGALSTQNRAGGFAGAVARKHERNEKMKSLFTHDKNKHEELDSDLKKKNQNLTRLQDTKTGLEDKSRQFTAATADAVTNLQRAQNSAAGMATAYAEAEAALAKAKDDAAKGSKIIDPTTGKPVPDARAQAALTVAQNTMATATTNKNKADGDIAKAQKDLNDAQDANKKNNEKITQVGDIIKKQKNRIKDTEKEIEGNKKNRMHQYMVDKANSAGLKYSNVKEDGRGNIISLGTKTEARTWKERLNNYNTKGQIIGKKSTVGGVVEAIRTAIRAVDNTGIEALKKAGDPNAELKSYKSNYKSPGSGWMDAALASSSHGGGSHGAGGSSTKAHAPAGAASSGGGAHAAASH